MHGLEGSL
jgi:hypothetical protein